MKSKDIEIMVISRALDLPEIWDLKAQDYFQTREFLNHTEVHNSCHQRYYLLYQNGLFETGVIVYTLRMDLMTYLNVRSPLRMNIVGVPCSVSACGIIGDQNYLPVLIRYIKVREKGFLLLLNLESKFVEEKFISGRTLPSVILINSFMSWTDYMNALKSNYRRRLKLLSSPFTKVRKEINPCSCFDARMYLLYLEVLKRSKGKLETLTLEFFRNLPSNFYLTAFYSHEKLIGWSITCTTKEKFYFFMGGIDYKTNPTYNTYFNILLSVVNEGVEKGASLIDLGQTAEVPKLRLGGKLIEKSMAAYHSNRIMRVLLKAGRHWLEYKTLVPETHVFKELK